MKENETTPGQPEAVIAVFDLGDEYDRRAFLEKIVASALTARKLDTVIQVDYVDASGPDVERFAGMQDGTAYLAVYIL